MLGTLVILSWWCALAGAIMGIGAVGGRGRQDDWRGWFWRFWVGLAVLIAVLQLWHFWLPVNGWATAALLLAGWLALLRWPLPRLRPRLVTTVVAFVGLAYLANRSTFASDQFDSLIYHLHAVEWNRAFAIVPGLGNLHDRLAFNNSGLLLAAAFELPGAPGSAGHVVNGLLWSSFALRALVALAGLVGGQGLSLSNAAVVLLMFPLLNDASHHHLSSPGTDIPAYLFSFAAVVMYLDTVGAVLSRRDAAPLLLCAGAAVCMKLTTLPVFVGLSVLVAARLWLAGGESVPPRPALVRVASVLMVAVLLVVPWAIRGVLLSGYPMYPLSVGRVDVDWAVPQEVARHAQDYVVAFAKTAGDHRTEFGGAAVPSDWWRGWLQRAVRVSKADVVIPAVLTLVAGMAALALRAPVAHALWPLIALEVGYCLIWFLNAPNLRFGGGVLWVMAATVGAVMLRHLTPKRQAMFVVAWLLFAIVGLLGPPFSRGGLWDRGFGQARGLLVPGPPSGLFHVARRTNAMAPFVTASGLSLHVPVQGEGQWRAIRLGIGVDLGLPERSHSCWPGPLLRTPYPSPGISLRDPSRLDRGFRMQRVTVDAGWTEVLP